MPPKTHRLIKDMKPGEKGFTLPWALDCEHIVPHDLTLNLVIRGDYPVLDNGMEIVRTETGINVIAKTVEDHVFSFSDHPMMLAWHPIPATWVE